MKNVYVRLDRLLLPPPAGVLCRASGSRVPGSCYARGARGAPS